MSAVFYQSSVTTTRQPNLDSRVNAFPPLLSVKKVDNTIKFTLKGKRKRHKNSSDFLESAISLKEIRLLLEDYKRL